MNKITLANGKQYFPLKEISDDCSGCIACNDSELCRDITKIASCVGLEWHEVVDRAAVDYVEYFAAPGFGCMGCAAEDNDSLCIKICDQTGCQNTGGTIWRKVPELGKMTWVDTVPLKPTAQPDAVKAVKLAVRNYRQLAPVLGQAGFNIDTLEYMSVGDFLAELATKDIVLIASKAKND